MQEVATRSGKTFRRRQLLQQAQIRRLQHQMRTKVPIVCIGKEKVRLNNIIGGQAS